MLRLLSEPQMIGSRVRSIRSKGFLVAISVSIAIVLGCMILLVLLPGSGRDKALKAIVEGILIGGIYAVIVLGVVVVYKATKVCNLAHGGVLTFLAYFLWWLLDRAGLPLIVAAIIVVLASLLFGLLINFLFMRRTIGQSGTITFMMTLILGFSVIYGFVILIFGGDPHIMPHIFPSGSLTVGNLTFSYTLLLSFLTATAMFLIFVFYFRYTNMGLAMRCVSEDNLISQSLGVSVKRIFALSWVIGCLSAAVGGALLGALFVVDKDIGGFAIMRALPILLLGGMESLPGAFLGAIIVGLTESLSAAYVEPYVSGFRAVLPYILMVAILILRPHGLFGLKGIRRL